MPCAPGWRLGELHELSGIDPWFLARSRSWSSIEHEVKVAGRSLAASRSERRLRRSSARASPTGAGQARRRDEAGIRALRHELGIRPVFKRVDTCAAEFASSTAYFYSTYEEECEAAPSDAAQDHGPRRRPEPHRAGHRVRLLLLPRRLRAARGRLRDHHGQLQPGDRLHRLRHLRPALLRAADPEDVLEIVEKERPKGVIVQYGGQTPLKLARALEAAGVPIIGTSPDSIDLAEDRERFQR
jgi:carbamoyl-phosphate synthase large subunit